MEQFKVGDMVNWSSKVEDGPPVKRSGVVVTVVPPNADPLTVAPKGFSYSNIDASHKKDHESYIILVGKRVFWPPVGKLRRGLEEG